MKVKFNQSYAGPGFHFIGGEEYDLPADDANYMIREGLADIVREEGEERPLEPIVQEIKKSIKRLVKKTVKKK